MERAHAPAMPAAFATPPPPRPPYASSALCGSFTRAPPPAPTRVARLRRRLPRMMAVYPVPQKTSAECQKATQACATLPELFRSLGARFPHHLAVIDEHRAKDAKAHLTFAELDQRIQRVAVAFKRLGLRRGDTVALFAENSHRWLIADQATMTLGAAAAVRGVGAPTPELRYIVEHSAACALLVESAAVFERLVDAGLDTARLSFVLALFGDPPHTDLVQSIGFDALLEMGEAPTEAELSVQVRAGDIAAILYTSGTTGRPKGVVLTHSNLLYQAGNISVGNIDPVPREVFVSVLPCWHVFERTAAYFCMSKAMTVVYSSRRRFREDLAKHRPHVLIAVPRVFENLHSAIINKLKAASTLRKKIFGLFTALSIAFVYATRRASGHALNDMKDEPSVGDAVARSIAAFRALLLAPLYLLANLLVWRKIRAATGGRVRLCVCGGGSLSGYLEDFYEAARIEICVGYGLTETSPVICNRFSRHNVRGSAGIPLPGTLVKAVDPDSNEDRPAGVQGELKVRGPGVFSRYLNDAQATSKAFDADGFFDTGDLGYVAPTGDVVITGRSKDVIVLSSGENVEPAPIEDAILGSPLIDQVVLVGQDEKALGALVVPELDALRESGVIDDLLHARAHELLQQADADDSRAIRAFEYELVGHRPVHEKLAAEIAVRNESRGNYSGIERIAQFRVVLQPFTVENGMMTQTLKIKKQIVAAKLGDHIKSMYAR